jgi:hypothetical protein
MYYTMRRFLNHMDQAQSQYETLGKISNGNIVKFIRVTMRKGSSISYFL